MRRNGGSFKPQTPGPQSHSHSAEVGALKCFISTFVTCLVATPGTAFEVQPPKIILKEPEVSPPSHGEHAGRSPRLGEIYFFPSALYWCFMTLSWMFWVTFIKHSLCSPWREAFATL